MTDNDLLRQVSKYKPYSIFIHNYVAQYTIKAFLLIVYLSLEVEDVINNSYSVCDIKSRYLSAYVTIASYS